MVNPVVQNNGACSRYVGKLLEMIRLHDAHPAPPFCPEPVQIIVKLNLREPLVEYSLNQLPDHLQQSNSTEVSKITFGNQRNDCAQHLARDLSRVPDVLDQLDE